MGVLTKYGRDYYMRLGRKGQLAMRRKYPSMAGRWGKLGGRPKKPRLEEITGREGK